MKYFKISIIAIIFLFPAVSFLSSSKFFSKKKGAQNSTKQETTSSSKTIAWPPIAIVNSKLQKSGQITNYVSTEQKIVALTFDADMTQEMERNLKTGKIKSWYNEKVIKELEKTRTPATLFLTGLWIKNYPDITEELAANPLFEIANHSYSHSGFASPCYKLPIIPDNLDEEEILQTQNLLEKYAPNYKKYFRFPGLCSDDFDIKKAQELGYKIIHGNIRGLDGFTYDTNGIVNRVVFRLSPGGVIILHLHGGPNAPRTAEALPEIIRQAKEKGYRFVRISELLNST